MTDHLMHATYQQQDGWFPIVGVSVERLSDLLFIALIVAFMVIILVYVLLSGKKLIPKIIKPVGILLLGVVIHTGILVTELAISTYHIFQHIPFSWYPVTALTIVPIAVDIPRQAAVWYLLAYCVVNAWLAVYGIEIHDDKIEKHSQAETKSNKTPLNIKSENIKSELFAGLRISIQ